MSFNPIQLDRLIDGELNEQQRVDFLRECEIEPARYRDVALAFIEAQALSVDLKEMSSLQPMRKSQPIASAEEPVVHAKKRNTPSRFLTPLAVAASMMLMLGVGYRVGRDYVQDGGSTTDPGNSNVATHSRDRNPDSTLANSIGDQQGDAPVATADNRSVQMVVFDQQSNRFHSVPIELMPSHELPDDYLHDSLQTTEFLRRTAQNAGHRLEHRQQFVPIRLDGNRTGIVPLDRYRVVRDQYQ